MLKKIAILTPTGNVFEMARAFPTAKVVGLDLVSVPMEAEKSNFEMVIANVNTDLPRFKGQFDLVYIHFIFTGVTGQYLSSTLERLNLGYSD